jgi:hypothetical protein
VKRAMNTSNFAHALSLLAISLGLSLQAAQAQQPIPPINTDPPLVDVQKDTQGRHVAQFSKRIQIKGQEACGDVRQIKLTKSKDQKTNKEPDEPGEIPLMLLAAKTGKPLIVQGAKCSSNGVVEGSSVFIEPEPQPAPNCKLPRPNGPQVCQ